MNLLDRHRRVAILAIGLVFALAGPLLAVWAHRVRPETPASTPPLG